MKKDQIDFKELREQHKDIFDSKAINAVADWTQRNNDDKTDEDLFLRNAISKIEKLNLSRKIKDALSTHA